MNINMDLKAEEAEKIVNSLLFRIPGILEDEEMELQKAIDEYSILCKRIQYCPSLNFQDVHALKSSWQSEFNDDTIGDSLKQELIYALLTVKKVKNKKRTE